MSELNDLQQRNNRILRKLVMGSGLMFGFAFAMVPLYDVLCDITGLNGKTSNTAATGEVQMDEERLVTVQFVTTASQGMPQALCRPFHASQRTRGSGFHPP